MGSIFQGLRSLFGRQKPIDPIITINTPNYSVNYNEDGYFPGQFDYNLNRTIAWTQKIVEGIRDYSAINYGKVLRTVNPLYEGKLFYQYDSEDIIPTERDFNYAPVLFYILSLRKEKINSKQDINSLGKILRFEINISTVDGAPTANSEGFVDLLDIPPIDTWFYVSKKYLYCWIPTLFIRKMQDAIDVEILDSYAWLEDIEPELNKQIIKRLENGD